MTTDKTEAVAAILEELQGHTYFKPEVGALRERLAQAVLEGVSGEVADRLTLGGFQLEASIGRPDAGSQAELHVRVDAQGVTYRSELSLGALSESALQELAGQLERLRQQQPAQAAPAGEPGTGVPLPSDSHDKHGASARLKVSPQWLKSVIPCSDYHYEEIDGKKYIREYYWSKELIERLFRIKCSKTTPEDLQYVARECCEGDLDWARELIAKLKSPNRPEPTPREAAPQTQKQQPPQSQRNQGSQPQKSERGQGQGQKNEKGAAQPEAKAPGGKGRMRSRSRNRKFRDAGKEGGKPDGGGAKP